MLSVNMLNFVMLSDTFSNCYADCCISECCNAEFCYAECHYDEYCYSECHHAEFYDEFLLFRKF
jgi:hypothetical protein